jgi:F-type H+-transporting ATPase subunit delta
VRQSIRGYTESVVESMMGDAQLARTAEELTSVLALLDSSRDLRFVLADPGVPVSSRRAVLTDLLQSRVGPATLRLVSFAMDADRATEFRDDVEWVAIHVDAAARNLRPVGDVVLGHRAAEERVDGYATGVLEDIDNRDALGGVEDELFRFLRIVGGSEPLMAALSDRDLPPSIRKGLVVDLLQGRASSTSVRLAAYATQVGRPRDYEALLSHLVDRVAAESNRRLAEVRVPIELDDDRRQQLAEALRRVTGHPVDVRVTVDPTVLGGFVATVGDTVVDGSTRHRLELLKERLSMPEAEITTTGGPS